MKKMISTGILCMMLSLTSLALAEDKYSPTEMKRLDQIETKVNDNMQRIMDGERNGSLKKDEVGRLMNELSTIQHKADWTASQGRLDADAGAQFHKSLNQLGNDIHHMESMNLRWKRS